MYIFMILYPFLILYMYATLKIVRKQVIPMKIKNMSLFWILPIPFIMLLERIIRSNAELQLGFIYGVYQFLDLIVIPFAFFLYVFILIQKQLLTYIDAKGLDNSKYFLRETIENIIFVSLINYWILNISQIVMNNTFLNWVDILVIPLSRMAMVQMYIAGAIFLYKSLGRNYTMHTMFMKSLSLLAIYVLVGSYATMSIVLIRGKISLINIGLNIFVVMLGYLSMFLLKWNRIIVLGK